MYVVGVVHEGCKRKKQGQHTDKPRVRDVCVELETNARILELIQNNAFVSLVQSSTPAIVIQRQA